MEQTPPTQPTPAAPTVTPAVEPFTTSSKPKSKGPMMMLIISLVVILLAGGGYYFYASMKPAENAAPVVATVPEASDSGSVSSTAMAADPATTSWKTYTNTRLKFSFKYPPEYTLEKEDETKATFSGLFQPGDQVVQSELVVNFKKTKGLQALKSCTEIDINPVGDYSCLSGGTKVETKIINGVEFKVFSLQEGYKQTQATSYLVAQTLKEPVIEFVHGQLGGGVGSRFEPILSTFKFLDSNQAVDTSNWKIYENTEANFLIKYPSDWTFNLGEADEEMKRAHLAGKEGKIQLEWGSGFGGGCPPGAKKMIINGENFEYCETLKKDGNVSWSGFYKEVTQTMGFGAFTEINKPIDANKKTMTAILATLEFNN